VAEHIGVTESTVFNWEAGVNEPLARQVPGIVDFLGYIPYRPRMAFPEWLKLVRSCLGRSQRGLAALLGTDQSTIRGWESGAHAPSQALIKRLKNLIRLGEGGAATSRETSR
jgi:DNA-binding transcriptional regulator YiaG